MVAILTQGFPVGRLLPLCSLMPAAHGALEEGGAGWACRPHCFYDPDLTDQPDFIDQTAFEVVVVGGCGVVVVCLSEERREQQKEKEEEGTG